MSRHARNVLRAGDEFYGDVCPDCGGPKHRQSRRCVYCWTKLDAPSRGARLVGVFRPLAVHSVGRRESILTFENERGGTRTVHAYGRGVPAQIADGLRQLPGDGWRVVCRSTPESILEDLRGRPLRRQRGDKR